MTTNLQNFIVKSKDSLSLQALDMLEIWHDSPLYSVQDVISEVADSGVDVYYSDLFKWLKDTLDSTDYMDRAIEEGLVDTNRYDFFTHISVAQSLWISDDLQNWRDDVIQCLAFIYLDEEKGVEMSDEDIDAFISAFCWSDYDTLDELHDAIEDYLTGE